MKDTRSFFEIRKFRCMVSGINWYTAHAEDGEGNSYNVYWKIKGDYDPEIMEEEYACDWDSPYMVVDEYGNTVEENVKIMW